MKEKFFTDFSLSHKTTNNYQMKDVHFHDLYEIYYSLTDNINYLINGKLYPINHGDLFIFNNTDLHKTVIPPNTRYERYVLIFNPVLVRELSTGKTDLLEFFLNKTRDFTPKIHLSEKQANNLLNLFEKAKSYNDGQSYHYGQEIYRKIILGEILLLINTFFHNGTYQIQIATANDSNYERIKPVLKYIHNNYNQKLSCQKLANKFNLSKYHLGHLFKKATGFSIYDYIINLRIMKSKELLRHDNSVSEVCDKVGFGSYSHFIRTFKNRVGIPPGQYSIKV